MKSFKKYVESAKKITESKKIVKNSIKEDVQPQNLKTRRMVPFSQIVRGDIIYQYNPHNGWVGDTEYMVVRTDGRHIDAVEYAGNGTIHISKDSQSLVPTDK